MDIINIEIPNKASYISTVRLTVASVANKMNFNCEEIEDLTSSTECRPTRLTTCMPSS